MKQLLKAAFFFGLFATVLVIPVSAKIGVGIGTGKIQVDDQLRPGIIYQLPPVTILNTGDETTNYTVSIAYHEKQTELTPPSSWFNFSPSDFELKPGESQVISIKLSLPLKVQPGNYFAYLEGHPVNPASKSNNTTIGVAAATKLYFTIIPATAIQGAYYKAVSFWRVYAPWTSRAVIIVSVLVIVFVFKKFFKLQVGFKKRSTKQDKDPQKDE